MLKIVPPTNNVKPQNPKMVEDIGLQIIESMSTWMALHP
jgi:hypothetical protein